MLNELLGDTVLIVGGTGSLGNALTERLLSKDFDVQKIIIFSRDEFKQHEMRLKFLNKKICTDEVIYANFSRKVEFQIGDIRDYHSVVRALKGVDVVFNTAAIKQVPVAEYYPMEAIKTNIIGTNNIITAISEFNLPVHTVVGISTDKACMPINAYGMTKSLMERLIIAANINCPNTRYVLTRYGNVMASRGSVIPLFAEQIRNGQDVTITDPNMTRFMMNLPQAVQTIIDTYSGANDGEIYIPRIPSAKVTDVADAMIGDKKIRTRTVGIRPGEKLHEQLISNAEIRKSYHRDGYYVITPALPELWRDISVPPDGFVYAISDIEEYSSKDNVMTPKEVQVLLEREGLIS
jgi:FlaA1/EpsC-like NDP-sugar epimerase